MTQPLRARLDAAHHRRAEHPHHGHDPAPAREHGHGGRRRERAARPLQHPGAHRPRPAVRPAPRLPHAADGRTSPSTKAYLEKRTPKPLRPGQMNYLSELPQVPRLAHEGLVRQGGDEGERLGVRLAAEARQALRHPRGRSSSCRQGKLNGYVCQGFNPLALRPRTRTKVIEAALEAEVPRHHRPARHRDLEVLAELRRVQRRRPVARSRPRSSASRPSCFAEEDGSLVNSGRMAAVALEGRRAAGRGEAGPGDHRASSSRGCARSTRRRAARSPTRS